MYIYKNITNSDVIKVESLGEIYLSNSQATVNTVLLIKTKRARVFLIRRGSASFPQRVHPTWNDTNLAEATEAKK